MSYPVLDVSRWEVMSVEAGGADEKLWLTEASHTRDVERSEWWLYKSVKYGSLKGPGDQTIGPYRRSDDRVEKLACELARLIALPAADVELAVRDGEEGLISHNVASEGWDLQPADVVLSEAPGYRSCAQDRKMRERPGHNLRNIRTLLAPMLGPSETATAGWDAFDVFTGYLVFDAWIANSDRHAMNWAVLLKPGQERLARSFDHGSALGSGLTDAGRRRHLEHGIAGWCSRGYAHRFEGGRRVTLVELAQAAVAQAGPHAADWRDRISGVTRPAWQHVISRVPGMSEVERRFVDEVLHENQRRLCDDRRTT
ncbi:hypothetical protein [Actinotalea subterranea]|uniref:hypothetical protein n=1 Tax=Actinotalea subterranea TaxID=2607497 RepID=UPI0011EF057B|nr:hypothetical protein [Actinotalea subterranea]